MVFVALFPPITPSRGHGSKVELCSTEENIPLPWKQFEEKPPRRQTEAVEDQTDVMYDAAAT
jgi:hypothetical protein